MCSDSLFVTLQTTSHFLTRYVTQCIAPVNLLHCTVHSIVNMSIYSVHDTCYGVTLHRVLQELHAAQLRIFGIKKRHSYTMFTTTNEAISTQINPASLYGCYLEYLDFAFALGYRLARFSLYFFVSPDSLRDISQKSRLFLSTSCKNASGCC